MKRKAAVAIILKGDKILMGLATSKDFRYGKWCFIGGGIEEGETPYEAAERESFEESGIMVKAREGETYIVEDKPEIVYVVCDYIEGELKPNEEFFELTWIPIHNTPKGLNVLELNRKILNKLF